MLYDMSKVIMEFDEFIRVDKEFRPWLIYDYDKINMNEFVEEITK